MKRRDFIRYAGVGLGVSGLPTGLLAKSLSSTGPANGSLWQLDGLACAALVNAGEISPRELALAAIERIEALDSKISAISVQDFESALSRADKIDRSLPFAGVPILLKDGTDYGDIRRPHGSRLFADYRSRGESPMVKRYRELGFNFIGLSKTPEFNNLASTEPLYQGPCHNPWSLAHSAGGSTGGGGAALAGGYIPIAHGTDGGGSLRIPAAYCGVFGFKPSQYRMLSGFIDGSSNQLTQHHAMTRSVRDNAALLAFTQTRSNQEKLQPVPLVTRPIERRLRIGVLETDMFNQAPVGSNRQAMDTTARLLESLGHDLVPINLPLDGDSFIHHYLTIFGGKLIKLVKYLEQQSGKRAEETGLLEPWTVSLARELERRPGSALEKANAYVVTLKQQLNRMLDDHRLDVMLSPVSGIEMPKLGVISSVHDYETLLERNTRLMSYTPVQNMTEMPAMSVPLYWSEQGLPVGSHFSARRGDEALLLGLAFQLEQGKPWQQRWAPHSAKYL